MNRGTRRLWRALPTVILAAGIAGAGSCVPDTAEPLGPQIDLARPNGGAGFGWDLPLMGHGQLARAFPGTPCTGGGPYRDFDFWVGEWNVTNVNGVHIGTNDVTSELDGCLVFEHWTASNGSRGYSLNDYDPETRLWNQAWVSQNTAGVFGSLRPSGGIVGGRMELTGLRHATGGFTFQDSWTWEENEQGQVIQSATVAVPELNFFSSFTGIYTRAAITPAPALKTMFCEAGQFGAPTRLADFLTGEWSVSAEPGPFIGTSVIESDLSNCLFIERFESRGGLRAIAFTYFDPWTELFYRIWVDSEGERLQLEGGFENGALVLQGPEHSKSGLVDVRITWREDGTDVLQIWEVSRDGGGTWDTTVTLAYSPG